MPPSRPVLDPWVARTYPRAMTWVDNAHFSGAGNKTITIPSGAALVIFTSSSDFYARFDGGTAAVPSADVTDGTASFANPAGAWLDNAGATFSLAASGACEVQMAFYSGGLSPHA